MATSLLLSAVLLVCLTTGTFASVRRQSPGDQSSAPRSVSDIIRDLADACFDGAGRSSAHQELRIGQEQIRTGQETLRSSHQELSRGQRHTHEQLSALQEQLAALQPPPAGCPSGWSRHENSCYFIPLHKAPWPRANHDCAAIDRRARLASIHTASHVFIESLVAGTGTGDPYDWGVWVGLVPLGEGGGWGWSDGTPLDFTNWASGEPHGGGSATECGWVYGPKVSTSGRWNDHSCNTAIRFLCQITLA